MKSHGSRKREVWGVVLIILGGVVLDFERQATQPSGACGLTVFISILFCLFLSFLLIYLFWSSKARQSRYDAGDREQSGHRTVASTVWESHLTYGICRVILMASHRGESEVFRGQQPFPVEWWECPHWGQEVRGTEALAPHTQFLCLSKTSQFDFCFLPFLTFSRNVPDKHALNVQLFRQLWLRAASNWIMDGWSPSLCTQMRQTFTQQHPELERLPVTLLAMNIWWGHQDKELGCWAE